MTVYRAFSAIDMLNGQLGSDAFYYYGSLSVATSNHFQIAYAGEALDFYGSFSFSGGYLTAGTFTGMSYTNAGIVEFVASNFSIDLYTFFSSASTDSILLGGDDYIYGSDENDTLTGRDGNDYISGGAGFDILYGGNGTDTLLGGSADDVIYGGSGNDTINGGWGNDNMYGGSGNDRYYINSVNDTVTEYLNGGTDTIFTSVSYTLSSNVEKLFLLGSSNINAVGNSLNNVLVGNEGKNTLVGFSGSDRINGGIGIDTMVGGTGNDSYYVDNTSDVVTENLSEGYDTVRSTVTYGLSSNVERLILIGNANIDATGNSLNNILVGNNKSNILDGHSGDDKMFGNQGDDIYYVDSAGDTVVELTNQGNDTVVSSVTYILPENLENMVLTGVSNVKGTGNEENNILTGNSGNNILSALAGDDVIRSGDGNDLIFGGAGDDKLAGQNNDDTLIGGNGNDILFGGLGNDVLSGGNGNDRLFGGPGDDTAQYSGAINGVKVDLNITTGQNTLSAGWDMLTDIENLVGSDFDDVLIGDEESNDLYGNDGNDRLYGRLGDDLLQGGAGNDILVGHTGDDILVGDAGIDVLIGSEGNDIFLLNSLTGVDVIVDFGALEDKIQLDSLVFTGLTETANQLDLSAFVSADVLDFNDVLSTSSILYEKSTGDIYFDGDAGVATNAQLVASVTDWLTLSNTDFDLI